MADNFNAKETAGETPVASDEIAGVKHQRVKIQHGADGSATDASTASPLPIQETPTTTQGLVFGRNLDVDESGDLAVAAALTLFELVISNTTAAIKYFKVYDKVTAPTVGTDTPVLTIPMQANSTITTPFSRGLAFSTGLGFGATGLIADADTTAIATATELVVNFVYK